MKLIIFLLSLLLASCTPALTPSQEALINTTVKIETPSGSGSGVILARQGDVYFIVTNEHVVSNSEEIFAIFPFFHYRKEPAEVLKIDPKYDLAVIAITVNTPTEAVVTHLCKYSPLVYDPVVAVGAGAGFPVYPTTGIISNPWVMILDLDHLMYPVLVQHTATLVPGNSGGPLFIQENNEYCVTGINSYSMYSVLYLAIPSIIVEEFIEGVF